MSKKASISSSSYILTTGIVPFIILQNMHSSINTLYDKMLIIKISKQIMEESNFDKRGFFFLEVHYSDFCFIVAGKYGPRLADSNSIIARTASR